MCIEKNGSGQLYFRKFLSIRLFIFCYIGTVKNTVRECSQFIQNKEQNVNYSVLYRNYLFDTRRVIWWGLKTGSQAYGRQHFKYIDYCQITVVRMSGRQCEWKIAGVSAALLFSRTWTGFRIREFYYPLKLTLWIGTHYVERTKLLYRIHC